MAVIERIEVFPVRIPVVQTFQFASGTAGQAGQGAPHVFVRVVDSDGAHGWGEGRPSPGWSSETLETVTATLRRYLAPALLGLAVTDRRGLHDRLDRVLGGHPTGQPIARAAVDMAVHDLLGRRLSLPLRALLGGTTEPVAMDMSFTLTDHIADDAAATVKAQREQGFAHFNFKVGVEPRTDIEVAAAVREAAGPEAFVWADANQGLTLRDARRLARAYEEIGIDVLEQPLIGDAEHHMRELRRSTSLPLAIDEASVSATDFFRHAAEGLVDYLVVKLTRSGGIWPTTAQLAVARAARLGVIVSGLTDSLLTKIAAAQTTAAYRADGPLALNGSQFLDESALFPDKARVEREGTIYLDERPGIGVEPDEDGLRELSTEQDL